MNSAPPRPIEWQDLFRTDSPATVSVAWRVLRRRGETLLVLPRSRAAAAVALALYPAQTAKARYLKAALRAALRMGLPLPLGQVELQLDAQSPFARFLAGQAGTTGFPQIAVLAGNPRTAGRRFVLLLFGDRNSGGRIVKAGMGEAARQLLEREERFLASVDAPGIPKPAGSFRDATRSAFSMEFLEGDAPGDDDNERVTTLIESWVQEQDPVSLGTTAPWRELETVLPGSPLGTRLGGLRNVMVRPVIWHGDLTPWNLKVDRQTGRCRALDWERGERAGVPGWDWFHWIVQPGVLVKRHSADRLHQELEAVLGSEKFRAYARRCGIAGNERGLALAYLTYNLEVIRPSEGATTIRALLDRLAHAWPRESGS